jgi:cobalt-zinc-cadmium efflux system protein
MAHDHSGHARDGHHAHHAHGTGTRRLVATLALTVGYMLAEAIGGWMSGSLALLADAGHMLSDAAALALALFAIWLSQRPANARATYGYHRSEILAALLNAAALFAISLFVVYEAVGRWNHPPAIRGGLALGVAIGGLLVNLIALAILHGGRDESFNLRAAWLHVLSDALGSVGAIASGALIVSFDWRWADAVASLLIALLVVRSAYQLARQTVAVLMEGAPETVDVDDVRRAIAGASHVKAVHDLHVWTLASHKICMSAHVVTRSEAEAQKTLLALTDLLRERFGIRHVTIQIEDERFAVDHCHDCEVANL